MKTKLFDGSPTFTQAAIIGFWLLNFIIVLLLWESTSLDLLRSGSAAGVFTALGRLFGLLAAFFALTQFILMGRLWWLERPFGLDHLASYHRKNGNLAFFFIIIHPIFIAIGYGITAHVNLFAQYVNLVTSYQYVWLAFIAQLLFIAVVGTSIYIVRRKLKFESWYYVHLLVYIAIVVAFFHQVAIGTSFIDQPLAKAYWYSVYIFVALNLLIWRFSLPVVNVFRYNFKVDKVIRETPTTTSIYISGRQLRRLKAKPGQFVFVRFLSLHFLPQEHPFSLSALVTDDQIRLTIREVGDYTADIKNLQPGTRVALSGPFGRFTEDVAQTSKRLYVAGGVGITPIRGLVESAAVANQESVLYYANRNSDDIVFEKEIAQLENDGVTVYRVFSDPPKGTGTHIGGYVSAELIAELTPDFRDRDIYICGPPPMMTSLVAGLTTAGVPENQLHYEVFSLH
jgi:predicted ferric reductase